MRYRILTAASVLLLLIMTSAFAQTKAKANQRNARDAAAIKSVLDAQCDAWNRGESRASWAATSILKKLFSLAATT